jgi:DNA-binding response OmpR family regulator
MFMPGKILLVEDDHAIAHSVRRLLAREGYFVAARESSEGALALLQDDPEYDLAILDIGLPGQDGFACCRALRASGWRAPVLMLTARTSLADRVQGLEAGADDYIAKPVDPTELLARVRAHLRRSRDYSTPEETSHTIPIGPELSLDLDSRDALVRGELAHLTDREFELLLLLARRPSESLSKEWLFQEIWGCAPETGIKVLAVYMRRLRQKVEANPDEPRYLQTVRGHGYRLVVSEASTGV